MGVPPGVALHPTAVRVKGVDGELGRGGGGGGGNDDPDIPLAFTLITALPLSSVDAVGWYVGAAKESPTADAPVGSTA